jgi:hypothetical protein
VPTAIIPRVPKACRSDLIWACHDASLDHLSNTPMWARVPAPAVGQCRPRTQCTVPVMPDEASHSPKARRSSRLTSSPISRAIDLTATHPLPRSKMPEDARHSGLPSLIAGLTLSGLGFAWHQIAIFWRELTTSGPWILSSIAAKSLQCA